MSSRRTALKKMFGSAVVAGSGGLLWGTAAAGSAKAELVLRPPGALTGKSFVKACIRCGRCIDACPYNTLKLADINDGKSTGTPFFEPRTIPCYMCTHYPCIPACPSGALVVKNIMGEQGEADIENARMGLAVIHKESCIAFSGIQCDVCYRACPLMGKAIVLEKEENKFTGKHANLKPVVNSDYCTGCGICESVCVTEKAAIFVLPLDKATGKTGDHYVKSWNRDDQERIEQQDVTDRKDNDDADVKSAIKYLNSGDELFDQ